MTRLSECVQALVSKEKPRVVFIGPLGLKLLQNPDALSVDTIVFKHGGREGGGEAVPFVQLTQELVDLLREIYSKEYE